LSSQKVCRPSAAWRAGVRKVLDSGSATCSRKTRRSDTIWRGHVRGQPLLAYMVRSSYRKRSVDETPFNPDACPHSTGPRLETL